MSLPLVKSWVESVQSLAADAYSILTTTPIPPPSRSDPNSTLQRVRGQKSSENDRASGFTQRRQESMSNERLFNTRSVSRFLDEFDASEEQKEDLLSNKATKDSPPKFDRSSLIRASVTKPLVLADQAEERRTLGIPEQSPPDAIKITSPMSKHRFSLNGPFQPINTITAPRSNRDNFYQNKTRRSRSVSQRSPPTSRQNAMLQEKKKSLHKKRRTDFSSVKTNGSTQSNAIDLDELDISLTGQKEEALKVGEYQTDSKESVTTPKHNKILRSSSSDELFGEGSVKTAKPQRPEDGSQERLGQPKLDNRQTISKPPRASPHKINSSQRHSLPNSLQQTPASRIEQRLRNGEESPDALQNDDVTPSQAGSYSQLPQNHAVSAAGKRGVKKSRNNPLVNEFSLKDYVFSNVPYSERASLVVNGNDHNFALKVKDAALDTEPILKVDIKSVRNVYTSDADVEARVFIRTNEAGLLARFAFEFNEMVDLDQFIAKIETLSKHTVKAQGCSPGRMDKLIENTSAYHRDVKKHVQTKHKRPLEEFFKSDDRVNLTRETSAKRIRLVDKLDIPTAESHRPTTVITGADRLGREESSNNPIADEPSIVDSSSSLGLSGGADNASRRTTRSRAGNSTGPCVPEPGSESVRRRDSTFNTLSRWKKPLVYPSTGKKRETVQFDDLQRLDDEEFLNDNLVSVFIRYLEVNADPTIIKKTHFFNSFLFETLAKDTKSRRGINFDAVRRWTNKVDLFSRDFVIVPVNENLHWFVMVICNLSYFKKVHGSQAKNESNESATNIDLLNAEPPQEIILESDLLPEADEVSARGSFAEMSLDDQAETLPSTPIKSSSGSRNRKKHVRRPLQKYAVDMPVIITLDSLDQARSSTASILRQYIVAEAKDKQGWEIDGAEIKGMTAKGIPHQNNFSDCGLYLCMYLEQFVLDPYAFVRRILQRSDEAGWPKRIESSGLRDRLRNLLLKLHDQQVLRPDQQNDATPPLGSILVSMGEHSQEDVARDHAIDADVADGHMTLIGDKEVLALHSPLHSISPSRDGRDALDTLEQWTDAMNEPITVDDDMQISTPRYKRRTPSKSQYFPAQSSSHENQADVEAASVRQSFTPERTVTYSEVDPDTANSYSTRRPSSKATPTTSSTRRPGNENSSYRTNSAAAVADPGLFSPTRPKADRSQKKPHAGGRVQDYDTTSDQEMEFTRFSDDSEIPETIQDEMLFVLPSQHVPQAQIVKHKPILREADASLEGERPDRVLS